MKYLLATILLFTSFGVLAIDADSTDSDYLNSPLSDMALACISADRSLNATTIEEYRANRQKILENLSDFIEFCSEIARKDLNKSKAMAHIAYLEAIKDVSK